MRQQSELRPYQNRIATHLYEHDEAMCVVRPGGGKTAAALTAIHELLLDGVIRHALIVAPKRVARSVWPAEIAEWAHVSKLRYKVLDGGPAERAADLLSAPQRDLTIVGLDVLPWLMDNMGKAVTEAGHPLWDLLVIDEISRLRNPKGERVKALVKRVNCWNMVWGLTGTLRPSSALDMFMPARVVTRGKLWGRSFYQWRKERFYPTDWMQYNWAPLPGAEDKINAEIAPLIVAPAEGELIQPQPTVVIDRITLPPHARKQYDEMDHKLMAQVASGTVIAGSAAVATGKMAQIANGFLYDESYEGVQPVHRIHDEKGEWLDDVVESATGPTLLIYEFRADLQMLRNRFDKNLPYLGAGVSDAEAARNIADWNAGKIKFMALHPASGGHGLNLQHGGADMAWIAPCWSPEFWDQTIARINRSGQKRQVMIRVCVADQTVDDMKLDRVYRKMSLQDAFEAYIRRLQQSQKVA